MKTIIAIDMGNAAFAPPEDIDAWTDEGLDEVARILRRLITKIEQGEVPEPLLDTFGNRVGTFVLTPDHLAKDVAASLATNPKSPPEPRAVRDDLRSKA